MAVHYSLCWLALPVVLLCLCDSSDATGFPPTPGGSEAARGIVRVCPAEDKESICSRDFDETDGALCLQQSILLDGQEQAQMSWCTCPPNTARSENGRECIALNSNEFCAEYASSPFSGSWTYYEGALGRMCLQEAGFATRKDGAESVCARISGSPGVDGVALRATLPSVHSPPEWHALHSALSAATEGSSIWQAWLGMQDVREAGANDSVLVWDDGSGGARQEQDLRPLSVPDGTDTADLLAGQDPASWIQNRPCLRQHVPWGFGQPQEGERCATLQQLAIPAEDAGGIGVGFEPLSDGVLTSYRMLVGGRLCSDAAGAPAGTDDGILSEAQITGLILCAIRVGDPPEIIQRHLSDAGYCQLSENEPLLEWWMTALIVFGCLMCVICFWVCVTAPWDRLYPDPKKEELRRQRKRKARKRVKKMEENRRASAAVAPSSEDIPGQGNKRASMESMNADLENDIRGAERTPRKVSVKASRFKRSSQVRG